MEILKEPDFTSTTTESHNPDSALTIDMLNEARSLIFDYVDSILDDEVARPFHNAREKGEDGSGMEEWEYVDVPTHPQKDGKWVATVAEIRDNATGIVREFQDRDILMDGDTEPSTFNWEDGNYSCDCNRRLFFARAAGEDEEWESDCGDGAYSVRVRNKKSGRVFYSEFEA